MFRLRFLAVLLASVVAVRAGEPHPSLPPPVISDCLGVNIHFTDPKPGELEMIAAAGFKWVRMDFGWAGIERVKGEYDFSAYDRLVAALDKFKMRAVFILDYGNPLYADAGETSPFTARASTPEFRAAFTKWAVAAVQHFKGRGYLWEMWNEPNGGFWKSADKTGDYIALAKATGEALRQAGLLRMRNAEVGMRNDAAASASPDSALRTPNSAFGEAFIGPATSTIDLPYLEACFKAGLLDYWDAVSVHPYRQNAPETVEEEYRSLRLLIRQYAPKDKVIPIISGEWGYSSAWGSLGKDEAARAELQGKYLPREFLTNIANDVALSIWYDWHDDGTDPKEGEHRFGIVSNEYHPGRDPVYDPKPAYTAMKTLAKELGGFSFNKALDGLGAGNQEHQFLFLRGSEIHIAAWQTGLWRPVPLSIFRPDGNFESRSYLGEKQEWLPASPARFDASPQYVTPLDQRSLNTFLTLASWSRLPLDVVIHCPGGRTLSGKVKNAFPSPLPLDMGAGLEKGGICGTGLPEPHPSHHIASGESLAVTSDIWIGERKTGPRLLASILLWSGTGRPEGFVQSRRIVVPNSLDTALLPPTNTAFSVRVLNPSAEAASGHASLHLSFVGTSSSFSLSQPISFQAGQRDTVLQFPFADIQNSGAKPISREGIENSSIELWLDEGKSFLKQDLGVPVRLKDFTAKQLEIARDGDASVRTDVTVAEASADQRAPGSDADSVRLTYHMDAGWKFLRLSLRPSPPISALAGSFANTNPTKYGLWIYGDGKGCQARIRFVDSTGQTFQPDGVKIDWQGWRYVTFPLTEKTSGRTLPNWGGANDGEIHYPIKWDTVFLLDNASRQPVEGEIYLSAPTLIY